MDRATGLTIDLSICKQACQRAPRGSPKRLRFDQRAHGIVRQATSMGRDGLWYNPMTPAPSPEADRNSMQFLRTVIVALLLPASAYASDTEVLQCRQIKNSEQRLTCYDAIDMRPAAAAADDVQKSLFGLTPKTGAAEADSVETTLVTDVDGWRPNAVFQLANGQRWEIADGSSSVMRPKKPNVRIRRGAFGAFYIDFDGINQSPRVKRID